MPLFRVVRHTVTLTDAQIKALPTTPVETVATPGAGKILLPLSVTYHANFAAAYTNVDPTAAVHVIFDGGSVLEFGRGLFLAQAGQWAHGNVGYFRRGQLDGQANAALAFAHAGLDDTALTIAIDNNSAGVLTGGNSANTLTVQTRYIVLDLPGVLRLVGSDWVVDDDPTGDPPDGYLTSTDGETLIIDTTAERGLLLAIADGIAETYYP
jgi:hypothetical protein